MIRRRDFVSLASVAPLTRANSSEARVLVYGATPAGIAAALAAASDGERVLLAEPTARIGGLVTCGLSHSDFRTFEGLHGAYLDFSRRVLQHYESVYGPDSPQAKTSLRGTQSEPKVNLLVFEGLLAAQPNVRVERGWRLDGLSVGGPAGAPRIEAATFLTAGGGHVTTGAAQWIDATYEGDLMAMAGVPFRTGREGRSEFGESLAPAVGDSQLQGYNFRFAATRDPANRVPPQQPSGYDREMFAGVLPLLADGRIRQVFGYTPDSIFKAQIPPLPNGKYDINDVSHSPVRLSLPGENLGWPNGSGAERQRIFDRHLLWNAGLLWFLQHDASVPAKFRDEARQWGWCRDEFTETNHLPPQLYVREARRMNGLRIFTENDAAPAPGDARAVLHRDSIAAGDYGLNCHGTAHEGPRFGGRHTGEFYKHVAPYQIPYGTLAPRLVANLLVPVAASSSHAGFCGLRLEPIWMSLGQAAGHAAHLALALRRPVQSVPVPRLQNRLWQQRAATIYVSDIPPEHPDFAAVQWWGVQGGLHGLAGPFDIPGKRGDNIAGQYFRAFPGHELEPGRALNGPVLTRWSGIARSLGLALPEPGSATSRLDWIRRLWQRRAAVDRAG